MAVIIEPKAFAVTEYGFTVSFQLDSNDQGYVEYSKEISFQGDLTGGNSEYGFVYNTALSQESFVHLVYVDPSVAGPGDILHYRLRIWNGSTFSTENKHVVRLRRQRSDDRNWSFVVMPNARDNTPGAGIHPDCTNYYLPTINSLTADFACCPGGMLENPNPSDTSTATSMSAYASLRSDLEPLNMPVYLSPGDNDNENIDDNKFARHAFFPCANLRTRGHQCIRSDNTDWQELESDDVAHVSQGSYYHFTWGNALFIHLNDWVNRNGTGNPDFNDAAYTNQKTWLEATLKEHRHKYKWCFLFTHSSVDATDTDANKSISSIGGAGQTYFTDSSTGIHIVYKISAHFHGQYAGWRVATDSNGTMFVCSTGGETISGTSDAVWHNQHAFAHVNIGMDQNRNVNTNRIKIDIVSVGLSSGTTQNEILNTSASEIGVVTADTGSVLDHNDTSRNIANVSRSSRVVPLGSEWIYNDQNHPTLGDDVDFITGTDKFYSDDFSPQMFNVNFAGTATQIRQFWKIGTAPFELNTAASELSSTWGYIYGDAITDVGGASTSKEMLAPAWSSPTTLTSIDVLGTDFTGNPIYYRKTFDIPNDIEPTEIDLIYNLRDVAFIWINGEFVHHTSSIGVTNSSHSAPFARTRRPKIETSWIDPDGSTPLNAFEPLKDPADGATDPDGSRTKLPNQQYEMGEQPVRIIDPTVINKLKTRNNTIAVLVINGRDTSGDTSRHSKRSMFDMSVSVHGSTKTTMFAPHITSPEKKSSFNKSEVSISWNIYDPPAADSSITTSSVTYEIEYTDNYQGVDTNWHTVKKRIPHGTSSYTWIVGKSIKSSTVRIRMRSRTNIDDRVSNWSISDEFSINVFELIPPAIISPLPKVLYSDFILIILDESLTRNTYHQKVRYTLEYSSVKRSVGWTVIATDIPVGQNVVRWNLDAVQSSDDYILRLTSKNASTSCVDTVESQPDQISRRFIHNINIQQSGMFLIDTKPPEAVLEIEQNTGVTNQLEQIINIFAEDSTSEIANIRLRECDAGSILALGDLEDPDDPTGGCVALTEVIQDLDKFGKPIPNSPKTQWIFEDVSGLKKIEALLTDIGGNTSLQEQVKVFLSIFGSTSRINDFLIVIEQRDKITIDDTQIPPVVISEPAIFEVVYIITTDRELWVLEPFARLLWTLDSGIEPKLLTKFNDTVYILTYGSTEDEARIYTNNTDEPELLFTFTDSASAGRNLPTAVAIFKNVLYIGMESGALWAYNGLSFSELTVPVLAPISSLFGDNQYLHIGFENSESLVLYNGTVFITLDLE